MKGFVQNGKAAVVIDGQWGSTGKGAAVAYIANRNFIDIATTNASANAGHTSIVDGRKTVCFHLPTSATTGLGATVAYINAGSIIDPQVFLQEIEETKVNRNRVFIHPWAAVITDEDKKSETSLTSGTTRIASTQKGVGAALARKVRREGPVAMYVPELRHFIHNMSLRHELAAENNSVLIEVPQGVHLGIHSTNLYPYCTSREVSVAQALSDAEIPVKLLGKVCMTLRTYPIRVGNIYDDAGKEIGNSGPCFTDQREMEWAELGVEPERTTVTKRVRRLFSWSPVQIRDSIERNAPDCVFLNFCNYLNTETQLETRVQDIVRAGSRVTMFGFGPAVDDVTENYDDAMKFIREGKYARSAA